MGGDEEVGAEVARSSNAANGVTGGGEEIADEVFVVRAGRNRREFGNARALARRFAIAFGDLPSELRSTAHFDAVRDDPGGRHGSCCGRGVRETPHRRWARQFCRVIEKVPRRRESTAAAKSNIKHKAHTMAPIIL